MPPVASSTTPPRAISRHLRSGPILLIAFAFAVMADPVSSVAYAVEAALRALNGDLALLLPTMGLVVAIIALVIINYRQLVSRYPQGGGASAAVGAAFGDGWSFIPVGALVVDFVLTIAISVSAGSSAVIAYFPALAPYRLVLALGLVVLAFPVAMALATGVEAPSSAIAQLGQLNDDGRRRFGRITLMLTLVVVGVITLGIAAEATRLQIGIPPAESTQIAELARVAAPAPLFAAFQFVTALLLLSAASSSFQAGPGLLKALAADVSAGGRSGILPGVLGRTNRHHTPYWGVVVFVVLAGVITAIAGGSDQELVLFYAVSVFLSFLAGLLAMARFSWRERRIGSLLLNIAGAVVVAFTLVANLSRGLPIVSLVAAVAIAGGLYARWVRNGRPAGIRNAAAEAEEEPDE
ncbi:MAG: amino acid permease [Humibacter sp.]